MSFFDIFKQLSPSKKHDAKNNTVNRLHGKLQELLPKADDSQLIEMACMSGLMARIAYADLHVHEGEVISIEKSLTKWTDLDTIQASSIARVAIEEIKDLAGQENHLYTRPLNDLWDSNRRYKFLEALFAVAAGDGEVEITESHEIKNICKGLLLEQKHFLSARTTVLDQLKSLK